LLSFVFVLGCTQTVDQTDSTATESVSVSFRYVDVQGIALIDKEFEALKGANAFDALKNNFEVDYDEYAFGPFVKSFDGITPAEGEYLALYVNGLYAEKGISEYVLSEDASIEFRFESLSAFPTD
jgi:hypothetical protein